MSTSNITQDHERHGSSAANEPAAPAVVNPTSLSTAPQLLLENSVANLWAAVKMAETTMNESARLLKEAPTSETIALVVVAQTQLVARLDELRFAMKVDFKHAGAEKLLKKGMDPKYQEAFI
ncbi:hypothetical protein MMC26_005847 [Xylographa opegraphella]|nr:hypothetical protein [Xylographa opegraphella]